MTHTLTTQLLEGGAASRLLLDRAQISVIKGPDKGVVMPLGLHTLIIGSASTSDLVLHDAAVSSRHARISIDRNRYVLRDLHSKNGVQIAGVAVFELPITGLTTFQIGTSTLQIKPLRGQESIELGQPRQLAALMAHSVKMRAVATTLERLAQNDITILLEGETGTGKEVAAHAIHEASARRGGPFVVFDCGAQTGDMAASELFGHVKGAFTGASDNRAGALAAAEGGTLLLDEVGELPLELQPLLLRALEGRETRAVGASKTSRHDVRILAATNRNLREEVRAGRFREDLLYRLAVATVRLPPLRERGEDVTRLAQHFANEQGTRLTPELLSLFQQHEWPGNVRELRHMVSRAAISTDPAFVAPDLGVTMLALPEARRLATEDFERDYLVKVLARAADNVTEAAKIAGVSRQMLTRLISKHGIRREP